ncbi:hypothetical protein F5148DRAFT_1369711 [Russula earlei]|uniref:Uncharacterized protein n=1 Tax=Russula earlei TaxID=71964 RepID=A0ACC0U0L7_9AGAM|nr:hypothetical protein F5148DRAFT_1369711 [Russula earlei]
MTTTVQSIFVPGIINTLPEDVLVEIFDFYATVWAIGTTEWIVLVHVCQRWRDIVFASSCRLKLRLVYTGKRPMSMMLDVWPILPVVIIVTTHRWEPYVDLRWENTAAFLESEHHHRICAMNMFRIPTSHWERLAAAMQNPFPRLTLLHISMEQNAVTSLPDSFLGGSAPLLRNLELGNCPFPGMPKLLLSAIHLVALSLLNVPDSGYFSPQALATALSVISRLEALRLEFQSPQSRPDPASRPRPLLTRSVLPALTDLQFRGVHEYLEDLLAGIEVPFLNKLWITFFMDLDFVVPQLHRLITHAEWFRSCDRASVYTSDGAVRFTMFRKAHDSPDFFLEIRCRELDYQLSSLAQVCSSSFLTLSTLVQLGILHPQSQWRDDMETTQWLELLDPFTAVKDLHLSGEVGRRVCQALEEHAEERVTEVLPALRNIFLGGLQPLESLPKFIQRFVAVRQLSDHPVVVYHGQDGKSYKKLC